MLRKQERAIERLAEAALEADEARTELHNAIRAARKAGLPLREIAAWARLSPEWVRRISSAA